jgi:hypothetical protein
MNNNFYEVTDQQELQTAIDTITHDIEMERITNEKLERFGEEHVKIWECKAKHVRKLASSRLNYLLKEEKLDLERQKTARHLATVNLKAEQMTQERNAYQLFYDEVAKIAERLGDEELDAALDRIDGAISDIEDEINLALGV